MIDKVWNRDYKLVFSANFLLYFAFYMLLPILPIYLMNELGCSRAQAGLVLVCFTITSILIRPFGGFMVDSFARKPLLMLCFGVYALVYGGYLFTSTVLLLLIMRTIHGFAYGMVSVSNSTVALDVLPSSRRNEGLGYYGISTNLPMAIGPVISLYFFEHGLDFHYIFLLALVSSLAGFVCVSLVHTPKREPATKGKIVSLDRFVLTNTTPEIINLFFISFIYGILSNYVAIYGLQEVGVTYGSGLFFVVMALGLVSARAVAAHYLRQGLHTRIISSGLLFLLFGFALFVGLKIMAVYYISALFIGFAYGLICPSYQALFIDMAENNRRGTAVATYLTAWDLGMGTGVVLGGQIAQWFNYSMAYIVGTVLLLVGFIIFKLYTQPHFHRERVR